MVEATRSCKKEEVTAEALVPEKMFFVLEEEGRPSSLDSEVATCTQSLSTNTFGRKLAGVAGIASLIEATPWPPSRLSGQPF